MAPSAKDIIAREIQEAQDRVFKAMAKIGRENSLKGSPKTKYLGAFSPQKPKFKPPVQGSHYRR